MNARQKAKTDMCRVVESICDENSVIISELVGFQTAFNKFKNLLAQVFETEQFRIVPLNGIAAEKAADRTKLAKQIANLAGFIHAYASATTNDTLRAEVNFSYSKFIQMRQDQLVSVSQNIHNLAVANLAALGNYGVTDAKLEALQKAIDDFREAIPKPRAAKGQKTTMTVNLNEILEQIDDILVNQMDALVPNFEEANPDFVRRYREARKIIDPATTKTQLKGVVKSKTDGLPIKGATVTIVELNLTTKTNSAGEYLFKPVQNGEIAIRINVEGFQELEKDEIKIKLGEINHCNFELSAV